jgi:hypothetical protein
VLTLDKSIGFRLLRLILCLRGYQSPAKETSCLTLLEGKTRFTIAGAQRTTTDSMTGSGGLKTRCGTTFRVSLFVVEQTGPWTVKVWQGLHWGWYNDNNLPEPVGSDDRAQGAAGAPITVDVLANDHAPEGDTLSVTAVTNGTHGTVAINNDNAVTYTPSDSSFKGNDTFIYTVADTTTGATATATVYVTVDPATRFNVSAQTNAVAGSPTTFTVTALDANGNTVTWYNGTIYFASSDGQATLPDATTLTNGVGTFTATLATTGDQIIEASNPQDWSVTGTTTINVSPPLVANGDTAQTVSGVPVTVNVLANDSGPDGFYIQNVGQPSNGTVSFNVGDTSVVYTPASGFQGNDSLLYTIADGYGHTATATVTVTVGQPQLALGGSKDADPMPLLTEAELQPVLTRAIREVTQQFAVAADSSVLRTVEF